MPVCAKILAQRSPSPLFNPQQNSPSKPKNTNFGVFSARWVNFFAHWAQQRGDDATTATTAAADAGQRETAITTAHPRTATVETNDTSATEKHAKNTHFSPAKAMTVSTCPRHRPAKATAVSDNHAARSYKPTPQQTRMQFDWVKFQRSLKTAQFQRCYFKIRKGRGGLHAKLGVGSGMWEVTTRCESCAMERAWPRCRWAAAGPGRASRSTTPSHQARVWRSRGRPEIRRCPEHQRDLIVEMGGIEIPSQRDARNNRQHNATTDGANRHRKNLCTA